jgi:hypothetical protein
LILNVRNYHFTTLKIQEGHLNYLKFYIFVKKLRVTKNFIFLLFLLCSAITQAQVTSPEREKEIEEVHIIPKTKKQRGKEIMKKVIAQREFYGDQLKNYSVETYCFTTLDKEKEDTLKDNVSETERIDQLEWNATSYYKANGNYKDVFHGYLDCSKKIQTVIGSDVGTSKFNLMGEESIMPNYALSTNPFLFIKGYKESDINLYSNLIYAPTICERPIISPLHSNAFIYYTFYLENVKLNQFNQTVYEIRIDPIFDNEALFQGTLYIVDKSFTISEYDLIVNSSVLNFFKSMQIKGNYELNDTFLFPTIREFNYVTNEGKLLIFGNSQINYFNFNKVVEEKSANFWTEPITYDDQALLQQRSYWDSIRPIKLTTRDSLFIANHDSLFKVQTSDTFLLRKDSIYNTISILNVLWNGIGFKNTLKGNSLWISSLAAQVVPLGVGGYRHRLYFKYNKKFKNGKKIFIEPLIDYGFTNHDVKGELTLAYLYNPDRSSRIQVKGGDIYDFINSYQSIVGTWGPGNRVRNQKIELTHRMELVNGLYLENSYLYSTRSSIQGIKYPSWVDGFGTFAEPTPFEGYKISLLTTEFEYRHHQKYLIQNKRKVVLGSKWPTVAAKFNLGIPNLFGGQSNFGLLEFRISDERKLRTFGDLFFKLTFGQFMYKNDLRVIEHKYFRTSDYYFFSNPTNSMQSLDTNMNTSSSYLQCNAIHHFNGFFLNKIWGINKLKLEESVGGGILTIPNTKYIQTEVYVGLERKFRIRKDLMKFGIYLISANSSHAPHSFRLKIGINNYDPFRSKWAY